MIVAVVLVACVVMSIALYLIVYLLDRIQEVLTEVRLLRRDLYLQASSTAGDKKRGGQHDDLTGSPGPREDTPGQAAA